MRQKVDGPAGTRAAEQAMREPRGRLSLGYSAPSSDVISDTLAFASPKSICVFSP